MLIGMMIVQIMVINGDGDDDPDDCDNDDGDGSIDVQRSLLLEKIMVTLKL